MQPIRSHALIEAVIAEIGENGSLDVTVSQIARRAGMSSALAHHYFGSKNSMFVAAMRHILTQFKSEMVEALAGLTDPRARVEQIIETSFSPQNFRAETASAWLNFYVHAQKSEDVARLLRIYHRRLETNLIHELRPLVSDNAPLLAEGIAALIDGAYIRWVLRRRWVEEIPPVDMVRDYLDMSLAHYGART